MNTLEPCLKIYYDVAFAKELYRLLHLTKGVRQVGNKYPRKPHFISVESLACHINAEDYPVYSKTGTITGYSAYTPIAFSVVAKNSAKFLAWDVDACATERAPYIVAALKAHGLDKATFKTNGSDAGRAKYICTLRHPMAQDDAIALTKSVYTDCINSQNWPQGPDGHEHLDLRPQAGEGGILRILGANTARNGPLEELRDLNGRLIVDIKKQIIPYKFKKTPYKIEPPKLSQSVTDLQKSGITIHTEHKVVLSTCSFLAHEALKVYGRNQAQKMLETWLMRIAKNSPEIMSKTVKRKGLLQTKEAYYYLFGENGKGGAWRERQRQAASWRAIRFSFDQNDKTRFIKYRIEDSAGAQVSAGVYRLYKVLDEYCTIKQIPRDSITIDAETIGNYLGQDTRTAQRLIAEAATCNVLVKYDENIGITPGSRQANTYRLISRDEYRSFDAAIYDEQRRRIRASVALKKAQKPRHVDSATFQKSAKTFIPTTEFERKHFSAFEYMDPGDSEGIAYLTSIIKNSIEIRKCRTTKMECSGSF